MITNGVGISTLKHLKLAETVSDAVNDILSLLTQGGELEITCRVSDKVPGESGHLFNTITLTINGISRYLILQKIILFPAIVVLDQLY